MSKEMKLQFESNLDYQNRAISSLVDLFEGQTPLQSVFTVTNSSGQMGLFESNIGIGNKLEVDNEDILENLKNVQLQNGLEQSTRLTSLDFDIEMETGTGKTYVYLKSILELNKKYGFCKFIIVVPSIAIKEGVYKSLQITKEHFSSLYDNINYDYFIYDSSKLDLIRSFATANHVSIMVINIDAFKKSFDDPEKENKANIIHRPNDKLNGMKPIELIQETNPFVIIDEPQSVDNTVKAKKAIKSLNPIATFRFSATHIEKHNLIYKLNAVDAFDLEIVKQIEVNSFESKDNHNNAYLHLKSVNNKKLPITARIELDYQGKNGIQRKTITVKKGDDLWEKSNSRDVYMDYMIDEIFCGEDNEFVSFTNNSTILYPGKAVGDINDLDLKRQQIKATIKEHLDKSLMLNKQGIKVLSLFFIDKVSNYRSYDEDGNIVKGKYALLFEEQFKDVARAYKYKSLFEDKDIDELSNIIHDGYFAQDKKGKVKDTKGNTLADGDAYSLIMKDKEKLLSFNTDLSFIFSHSALREGWDNPNVFQICTLNETKSVLKKRQEIGRGLRLCVNQKGQRQYGFSTNTLTVMANESYEDFCKNLQHEYEEDEGIKFGVIQKHTFANIVTTNKETGEYEPFGLEKSDEVFNYLINNDYIEKDGVVKDKLKVSLSNNALKLPESAKLVKEEIINKCKKAIKGVPIKSTKNKRVIKLNKKRCFSPEFTELWEKIKYKTTYRVDFDSDYLVHRCVEELKLNLRVKKIKHILTKASVEIGQGGVKGTESSTDVFSSESSYGDLPDVVSFLQNKTNLTRRSIIKILVKSNTLNQFKVNPQKYMDEVSKLIRSAMRVLIVDGIKYTKIGDDSFYAQELFEEEELVGYLEQNMIESKKSIYDYVVYDSKSVEKTFAEKLETNERVIVYVKLPSWFKINTPLGSYNPDWAVVVKDESGNKKIFFVLETKGSILTEDLRPKEKAKITCGYKHFEALGSDMQFREEENFENFIGNT